MRSGPASRHEVGEERRCVGHGDVEIIAVGLQAQVLDSAYDIGPGRDKNAAEGNRVDLAGSHPLVASVAINFSRLGEQIHPVGIGLKHIGAVIVRLVHRGWVPWLLGLGGKRGKDRKQRYQQFS